MQPRIIHTLPDGFLEAMPRDMEGLLQVPTLMHIAGEAGKPALFVSTLLHGNEHSGLFAVQALLRKYRKEGRLLPRPMLLFIGNLRAAHRNCRLMPGQVDYNRIWDCAGDSEEHDLARNVLDYAARQDLFAAVDIHNNTGANPHYGCVNHLDRQTLSLARLFGDTLVYFTEPHEVLANAFSQFCPSFTIECGLSGEWHGVEHSIELLEAVLAAESLDATDAELAALDVHETVVRVRVPKTALFDFGNDNAQVDFRFPENFEHLNFVEQPEGSLLGWRFNADEALEVIDNAGNNVAHEFIYYEGNEIRTRRDVVPSMFTKDKQAVVTDCLGYFMLRRRLPAPLPLRQAAEREKVASGS